MKNPHLVLIKYENLSPSEDLLKVVKTRMACMNPNCDKTFKTIGARQTHMRHCSQPPRFKCGYCDHYSTTKKNIRAHSTSKHRKLKLNIVELFNNKYFNKSSFPCPNENCSKSFETQERVVFHMKYRCCKLPRFKCFYCEFKSYYKYEVKLHNNSKHANLQFHFIKIEE